MKVLYIDQEKKANPYRERVKTTANYLYQRFSIDGSRVALRWLQPLSQLSHMFLNFPEKKVPDSNLSTDLSFEKRKHVYLLKCFVRSKMCATCEHVSSF